jgi:hypothetical protein
MASARHLLLATTMVLLSIALGVVGGAVCGAAILSFGDLIGRSGSTGSEYVGYWSIDSVWLGFLYGGLLGGLVTPVAYLTMVRNIGFRKAFLPAATGTLLGGAVGAIGSPPTAALAGVAGFFLAISWTVQKVLRPRQLE